MRDLASFADVNRHSPGSLKPYLEILSNISVMNDCARNIKSLQIVLIELTLICSCHVIEWELINGIHIRSNEADSLCMQYFYLKLSYEKWKKQLSSAHFIELSSKRFIRGNQSIGKNINIAMKSLVCSLWFSHLFIFSMYVCSYYMSSKPKVI